ncbi:hypothetical protein [Brachyspira intermedia]|uniref:hypothetical protein n=1 Tax=Brachyspira intermedia TaxID=84377 RepID=UPI003006C3BB
MKYLIFLCSFFVISCCSTKYITVPLTTPPNIYNPGIVYTEKDIIREYKRSLMKISEWQNWYNVQTNIN